MTPAAHRPLRVLMDSNVIISSVHSHTSISRSCFLHVVQHHRLLLSEFSIQEIGRVIQRKFPGKQHEWHALLHTMTFERIPHLSGIFSSGLPFIRDPLDIPILTAAAAAQPDYLVTGDLDFHTDEILNSFPVISPAAFLHKYRNDDPL